MKRAELRALRMLDEEARRERHNAQARERTASKSTGIPPTERQELVLAKMRTLGGIELRASNLSAALGWPVSTLSFVLRLLIETGDITVTGNQNSGKRYSLPLARLAEWHGEVTAAPIAPVEVQQPATRTESHSYPTQLLTGELGAARKLLAGLNSKSARALACAGNYRYGGAEELFGQLRERGWV